jgi:WD40 repeat protein
MLRVIAGAGAYFARFSADGKLLVTASGAIKFWRVSDGTLLCNFDQAGATCLAIAPNGKWFAYGRGDGAVIVARMPLVILEFSQSNSQSVLGWQGGSGLYQLQSRTDLSAGTWQNVGSATASTSATNSISGTAFYRVQSLPNP